MRDTFLFATMLRVREEMIKKVEQLPEEKRKVIPEGFNNNIHWQIGHLLTVTSHILFHFSGKEQIVPENYFKIFGPGSKPAEWTDEVPAWDTLLDQFREQCQLVSDTFAGQMNEPVAVKDNFAKAETVGELLVTNINHEGKHAGMITAMLKVLA